MVNVDNSEHLASLVLEAVTPSRQPKANRLGGMLSLLIHRWPVKLGTLGLVSVLWLLLAGQQDFEVDLRLPLDMRNLPPQTEILEPLKPEVQVTIRGLRKDASTLNERNIRAEIDLSPARFGARVFRITRDQIVLPNDRIYVVNIRPPQVEFKFKEEPRAATAHEEP